ncbi:MAG: hypothetical protein KA184_08890 [Candidatus Hydrogenedentes bacterium]|nr:hypothetical protein [Candidatus Hydrogenedentota bacterium]
MSDVKIIQMRRISRVICGCGLDKYFMTAPNQCPACGSSWDQPLIEEAQGRDSTQRAIRFSADYS